MPTLEAILRASGRVTGCRGESPDRTIQHGKRQRPPCRERLIRRARQRDHRNVSDPAHSRGPAGLQRDAMGDDLAAPGQGRHDRIVAADAAAARGDEHIAGIGPGRLGDGCRIASRGIGTDDSGPRRLRAFRDQPRRQRSAGGGGNIDDAQPRTPHIQFRKAARARDQEIERTNAPPGSDRRACFDDFTARAANALPRRRFRQRLHHRTGLIQQVGIDHAVAAHGHGFAGFDPDRRCRKRQRRIGRGADEIAGAQGPAIADGDVARGMRAERRHISGDAAHGFRERKCGGRDRFNPPQQRRERRVERGERNRQALGRDHLEMVDHASSLWQPWLQISTSSRRTPGPITTAICCCERSLPARPNERTQAYGSRRSPGRRCIQLPFLSASGKNSCWPSIL